MVILYDRCILNSTIEGKLCTISWYVDNNKVSHVDEHINTRVIEAIAEHFGELTVSRGVNHKFLIMEIKLLNRVPGIQSRI